MFWQLNLDSFEADAEICQFIIVFLQFLFPVKRVSSS